MKLIEARGEGSQNSRYVYRYYLPKEVYAFVVPADIWLIYTHFFDNDSEIMKAAADDVEIVYPNLKGARKIVSREVVALVLNAWDLYYQKWGAEETLSPDEIKSLHSLNETLVALEKTVVDKCLELHEVNRPRLSHGEETVVDHYEIDVQMSFYLQHDDPWYDESADIDEPGLVAEITAQGDSIIHDSLSERYVGIGDRRDHRESPLDYTLFHATYCYLFHVLHSHCNVPFADMIRIRKAWIDVHLLLQNEHDLKF